MLTCNKCGKDFFITGLNAHALDGAGFDCVYASCPHCKAKYIVSVSDQKTVELNGRISNEVAYLRIAKANQFRKGTILRRTKKAEKLLHEKREHENELRRKAAEIIKGMEKGGEDDGAEHNSEEP